MPTPQEYVALAEKLNEEYGAFELDEVPERDEGDDEEEDWDLAGEIDTTVDLLRHSLFRPSAWGQGQQAHAGCAMTACAEVDVAWMDGPLRCRMWA